MKKTYIKPEMNVEEIALNGGLMLATSGMNITDKEVDEAAANGRRDGRGTWGNLWD